MMEVEVCFYFVASCLGNGQVSMTDGFDIYSRGSYRCTWVYIVMYTIEMEKQAKIAPPPPGWELLHSAARS